MTARLVVRAQPEDIDEIVALDRQCLEECEPWAPADDAVVYVVHDIDGRVCAFGSAKPSIQHPEDTAYLDRAGVAKEARGRGLQRKLIQARLRWARQRGMLFAVTDTLPTNAASGNNLIRCGFQLYRPAVMWAGEHWCYWRRSIVACAPDVHTLHQR